jgi:hypothetical protein
VKRVTLVGIQRRGLVNWKAREKWIGRQVSIWSREHQAWWRPNAQGYTDDAAQAGVWDFADAYDITKHCGPEKRIVYYAAPTLPARQDKGGESDG